MKFKPYPEYKDSGVKWIGEIPQNWKMRRLKYNCSVNPPGKKSLSDPNAKVNFLPMEKVSEEGDYDLESKTEYENVSSGYTYFEDNDVLLAKITPCFENGKGALVENLKYGFGFGTTEFHILRNGTEMYPKYLYFLTKSHLFRVIGEAFMEGAAGQKRVSTDFVKNFPMPTPSMAEQKLIVNYLEKKTSEIDLTIEKDTRLIELLKEKRTALINHVVTKGLDPTVKMKDSGVEWIGEIPEDWNARKLKFFVSKIGSGITPKGGASVYVEEGIALLRSQNIHFDGLRLKNVSYITEETNKTMLNSVVKNKDVLLNITGASIGRCTYFENQVDRANVNQHVCIIRPKTIFHRFLNYVLMSNIGQDQIFSTQMGSSREGVNFEQIGNFVITYPPYEEQEAIANYLDKSTQKIDLTIQKIQEKINFLEEYKKSLIHHVVTGKVDVREVAV